MFKDDYISGMRKVSASPELRERLVRAMEQPASRKPARRFPRAWAGVAAAAAAVAIALPVWMNGISGKSSTGGTLQDTAAPSAAAYAVIPEEKSVLTAEAAPDLAAGAAEPRDGGENGASNSVSMSWGTHPVELNPSLDLSEDEMPRALPVLVCDSGAAALREAVERLSDALGLSLDSFFYDTDADSAAADASSGAVSVTLRAGVSGVFASADAESAPAYEDVRDALGGLALSLAPDGSKLTELSAGDGAGGTFYALFAAPQADAAQQIAAYALSCVTVHVTEDGALTYAAMPAKMRTGETLTLLPFGDALEQARRQLAAEALHWAVCYGSDGLPYYEFYVSGTPDGTLCAALQVAAAE